MAASIALAGLRAVFPAGGAHQRRDTLHDLARIGAGQLLQAAVAQLLQPRDHRGPDAFNGQQRLFIGGGEWHGGFGLLLETALPVGKTARINITLWVDFFEGSSSFVNERLAPDAPNGC